jgi:hypothetical protein
VLAALLIFTGIMLPVSSSAASSAEENEKTLESKIKDLVTVSDGEHGAGKEKRDI